MELNLTVGEILEFKWYVKKPFDVRAEMLARPNEWVGAYKDSVGKWHKVAFDFKEMRAVETPFLSVVEVKYHSPTTALASSYEFEKCIPIEDVPTEEMK